MFSPTLYSAVLAMALTGLLSVRGVHYGPLDSTPDCSLVNGGIIQPAADTSVSNGDTVPFAFAEGFTNQCHDDYTPISAWLLAAQPISGSLNANHEFDDFLFHFGDYMINTFPTIIPQKGTPPPANLSIPDLGVEFRGRDVYIAVVQSAGGCPPDGHINWCFSSNVLHYITN